MTTCFSSFTGTAVLALLLVVGWSSTTVSAYPEGAGGCTAGQAAVGATHLFLSPTTGSLADGGYTLSLAGMPYADYTTEALTALVAAGGDIAVGVDGPSYKGILLRIGEDSVDFGNTLMTDDPLYSEAANCAADVGSITHVSPVAKTSLAATLNLDDVMGDPDLFLDITIVVSNGIGDSEYYFTRYALGDFAVESVSCGLFGRGWFCLFSNPGCGKFGRILGLCKS